MARSISGRFEDIDEARRAVARLARDGLSPAALRIVDAGAHPTEQPDGLQGVQDPGAPGGRHVRVAVRIEGGDGGDAARRLRSVGATDIVERDDGAAGGTDRSYPTHGTAGDDASGPLATAGRAWGAAVAEAVTAAMSGVSASAPDRDDDGARGDAGARDDAAGDDRSTRGGSGTGRRRG